MTETVRGLLDAFDSLSDAKHLRDNGVPQDQAEAHAEAARQFIMAELVTKSDLQLALDNLALRLMARPALAQQSQKLCLAEGRGGILRRVRVAAHVCRAEEE